MKNLPDLKIPELSLILPCYNEKDNLKPVVESAFKILKEIAREFEIIIVDDGSTDGTGVLAEELVNTYPQVRLVQHPKNLGYGSALRSGFKKAKYRWLFFTDADQQFQISPPTSRRAVQLPDAKYI